MRKKLNRLSLRQLASRMSVVEVPLQSAFVGGGDGSLEDPFSKSEFLQSLSSSSWEGGYVSGVEVKDHALIFTGDTSVAWLSGNIIYGGGTINQQLYDGGTGGWKPADWATKPFKELNKSEMYDYVSSLFKSQGLEMPSIEGLNFAYGGWKASVSDDKKSILLGDSFIDNKYTDTDRCSVILHEIFHYKKHQNTEQLGTVSFDTSGFIFSSDFSEGVLNYFRKTFDENMTREEVIEKIMLPYGKEISKDGSYYLNEIECYQYELSLNLNISEDYRNEIEGKIYQYGQLYKLWEHSKKKEQANLPKT